MRTKSYARLRKAAKVEANGRQPARLEADRRGDHLLLGDVHLEVALGMRLREDLGERRVRHLAVDGDDIAPGGADGRQRVPVRLARRHLLAELVARQLERARLEAVRLARVGQPRLETQVAHAAQLGDRGVGIVQRLAVPAVLVLDGRHALALQRAREDRGRPAGQRLGVAVRLVDLLDVVAVDLDRVPAEGSRALGEHAGVTPDHRLAALPEAVDVDDRREVVECVVRRVLERLPHRSLGELGVSAEHPDAVGQPVEVPAGDGHADADRQALAERAGGDVHPRQHRGGVAFELASRTAGSRRSRRRR